MTDRIPTFGDICSAIAEGHLAATVDGSMYQINALELRRFLSQFRSLPAGSAPVNPSVSPQNDSGTWPSTVQTSVA
jgi:hypothetical protein